MIDHANLALTAPGLATPGGLGRQFALFVFASFLLALLGYDLYLASDAVNRYPVLIGLCTLTALLSASGQLLAVSRNDALAFVSFLFCYLFMGIAAIAQITSDSDPVFNIEDYAVRAAVGALIFTVMGLWHSVWRTRSGTGQKLPQDGERHNLAALAALTGMVTLASFAILGSALFTSREGFGFAMDRIVGDGPLSQLVATTLLLLPFFGSAIGLRRSLHEGRKAWASVFLLLFSAACVLNNPLISARFKLAGLVFFFLDYIFYGRKTTLLAMMLVAGVAAAPAFNTFRGDSAKNEISLEEGAGEWFQQTFVSMDYDAFETSAYTVMLVDEYGFSLGSNLIGAGLFFVPRSFWTTKPVPTAWIIAFVMANYRFVGTANLSTPLMAEGYFAFGWLGVVLVSWGYWKLIRRVTEASWRDGEGFIFLLRGVGVGLALIVLRGTLIVGVSAVAAYAVSAYLPYVACRWNARLSSAAGIE